VKHLQPTNEQKQLQWDYSQQECTKMADRLGTPLDPGIFETIVAFHALQIHTCGSC
jgi:hypothetical protein